MGKKRTPEEISKMEKIELLRLNGWYELKSKNNWVNGIKVPKNWKGVSLEEAFDVFYKNNKRKIY